MTPMKKLLVLAALASGCHSPKDWDPDTAYDNLPRRDPVTVDHRVEAPSGPDVQYLAMSVDDKYALCAWTENRAAAEEAGRRWEQKSKGAAWYVLWRQKPAW